MALGIGFHKCAPDAGLAMGVPVFAPAFPYFMTGFGVGDVGLQAGDE